MNKKYDEKLIKSYITGDDITDFDIEKLENDADFMMQVIDYSDDIKMYSFCGEELKKDYKFVSYLVDKYNSNVKKYKNDIEIVVSAAESFLDSRKNLSDDDFDVESIELSIIMEDILKDNEEEMLKYALENNANFNYLLIILSEEFIKQKNIGLGFGLLEQYFKSNIILDYYAKNFLEEIFYRNKEYKFEAYIHRLVKDKNEINEDKANSFIINTINGLDESLSWYLTCHIYLLDKMKKDLKRVYNYFGTYNKNQNQNKAETFIDYIERMYKENENCPDFTCTQLLGYIIKELNLEKVFDDDSSYVRFKESEFYNPEDYKINLSKFVNQKFLNEALKKAQEIFISDTFKDADDYLNEFNKRRAEILKLKS